VAAVLVPPPDYYELYRAARVEDYDYGYLWYLSAFTGKPVSPEGRRVLNLINWVWRGIYHTFGVDEASFANASVTMAIRQPLNTYDDDYLTRLVVGAHNHAIRVGISPGKRRWSLDDDYSTCPVLEVSFSPRDRIGSWQRFPQYYRHPTMAQAAMTVRLEPGFYLYNDPPIEGPGLGYHGVTDYGRMVV
jgi:hypothetical protein